MSGFPPAVHDGIRDREGGRCARCAHPCLHDGQAHHRRPKGMGGSTAQDTNTHANGLWLCAGCHAWVHAHPGQAREEGWLVAQGRDPAAVPVRYRGTWTVLAHDGSFGCMT